MTPFLDALRGLAVLAPMAGITDRVFRELCRECGCPFAVTEMVSAKGFVMSPSLAYGRGLLDAVPGEVLSAQLFGHEPEVIARAAEKISQGPYCAIDLNMGCPAPKITGGGEGSALLRTPKLAQAIAREAVRASRLPITVKMRLGWNVHERCHVDFARLIEDAGVSAIAVHGRTRDQMYSGKADWDAIGEVVRAVSIPVIANGDVNDVESFCAIQSHTNCHAVMIGRGALGNPFLFAQIQAHLAGEAMPEITAQHRVEMAKRHATMLCAYREERFAIPEMRKHAAWYVSGVFGGASIRRRIHGASTLEELCDILDRTADGVLHGGCAQ